MLKRFSAALSSESSGLWFKWTRFEIIFKKNAAPFIPRCAGTRTGFVHFSPRGISLKNRQKTNPITNSLIESFRRLSYKEGVNIWKDIANRLSKSTRTMAEVNVGSLSLHTEADEVIAVPGKVLGFGYLDHPLTVAGMGFTEKARRKIQDAGGECITLMDLADKYPDGSGIRIMA